MLRHMQRPTIHCTIPSDNESDVDDSDAYSAASMPPFSPNNSTSSYTSYDVSMRSASPAPSVWSMSSSMRAQAFKQEFGRGLNNYSEVYRLPADDEELDRLNKQHAMFIEVMGKYPPPMYAIMADNVPGETKTCLDLGCGSGSWIIDVANDFPHCSAVAVDLVPMQSLYAPFQTLDNAPAHHPALRAMPPNCRSEMDDINLGLEHFYGDFNVVHAQLISSGIKDYEGLIDHISRVLRPGGLITILEWDFHAYDENHSQIEVGTHQLASPWWPRWLAFAQLAVQNHGGSPDAASHLWSWISNHPSFEDAVSQDFWIPATNWPVENSTQMRIGATMRDDILAFLQSGRPLLLGSGVPEAVVNELQNGAEKDLKEAKFPQYIRLQGVYARKKHP